MFVISYKSTQGSFLANFTFLGDGQHSVGNERLAYPEHHTSLLLFLGLHETAFACWWNLSELDQLNFINPLFFPNWVPEATGSPNVGPSTPPPGRQHRPGWESNKRPVFTRRSPRASTHCAIRSISVRLNLIIWDIDRGKDGLKTRTGAWAWASGAFA